MVLFVIFNAPVAIWNEHGLLQLLWCKRKPVVYATRTGDARNRRDYSYSDRFQIVKSDRSVELQIYK